jgi:hypothetical protein
MAISLDCLFAALGPLVVRPEEWLDMERLLAKTTASQYNLRSSELSTFDLWWKVVKPARELYDKLHKEGDLDDEVEETFTRLERIVNDGAVYDDKIGFRRVRRVPGEGRFVIFSDLHMAFAGSRQDFFKSSGNADLYAEVLGEYAEAGFTLVENGDVEELLIHEPSTGSPDTQLDLLKAVKDPLALNDNGWGALDAFRADLRLGQLSKVIANHRDLYEQINTQFVEQGRYIKIAGNHDQDLQSARFLGVLRTVYPKLDDVYDFLVIEAADGGSAPFVVCHGHHFDRVGTPKYSKRIGETYSECLGWPYQGADRVWRWEGLDGVQRWTEGGEPFSNTLVSDDAGSIHITGRDALEAGLVAWLGTQLGGPLGMAAGAIAGLATAFLDKLSDRGFWESNFGHNIAWEYFRSSDAGEALFNEVLCGRRWFKFRHLDEMLIASRLQAKFGSNVPNLVVGHSHEPRHLPLNPTTSKQVECYLNSGAAGRFENLIWGLEILDGVPQVVAWHRPGGPRSGASPERRAYTPDVEGGRGLLVPSDAHVPLSTAVAGARSWIGAVLHMSMATA